MSLSKDEIIENMRRYYLIMKIIQLIRRGIINGIREALD